MRFFELLIFKKKVDDICSLLIYSLGKIQISGMVLMMYAYYKRILIASCKFLPLHADALPVPFL
jgi:hypothetical protein